MVSTEKPDLILLDIKMPGMTGLEVLEKLNKVESRPEVIMISGHGGHQVSWSSRCSLGAAEFIDKPFDVREVEIHINGVLERVKLRRKKSRISRKSSRSEADYTTLHRRFRRDEAGQGDDRAGRRLGTDRADPG